MSNVISLRSAKLPVGVFNSDSTDVAALVARLGTLRTKAAAEVQKALPLLAVVLFQARELSQWMDEGERAKHFDQQLALLEVLIERVRDKGCQLRPEAATAVGIDG